MTRSLLEEVVTAPRRTQLRMPDSVVTEREGWWQISTPSLRQGGLNEVARCVVDERDIERVIDETLAHYAGRRFRWSVMPGSKPDDLGERLARRGLMRSESIGMARATTPAIDAPAGMEVVRVDAAGVDEFTRVMAEGWEKDPAEIAPLHRFSIGDPRQRFYVGRVDGETAGCANYGNCGTSAYLIGGVVLPRFRGRGLYRALIAARLADAAAEAIPLAVTHARAETSAPMLAHLGFETVCTFASYSPV